MTFSLDNFRGQILWRPTESVGVTVADHTLLAQAEVGQFHMPILVKEDVFGFQVTIDDAITMQTLKREQYFSCVEARAWLCKPPFSLQVVEKLPSIQEIHDEVQLLWCLEGVVELHDEGMVDFL